MLRSGNGTTGSRPCRTKGRAIGEHGVGIQKIGSAEQIDAGVTLLGHRCDIFGSEDPDVIELTLLELGEGLIHRAGVCLPARLLGQSSDFGAGRRRVNRPDIVPRRSLEKWTPAWSAEVCSRLERRRLTRVRRGCRRLSPRLQFLNGLGLCGRGWYWVFTVQG